MNPRQTNHEEVYNVAHYSNLINRKGQIINYSSPFGKNKKVVFHGITPEQPQLPDNFSEEWVYYFSDNLKGPFILNYVKQLRQMYSKLKIIASFYSERFGVPPLSLPKFLAIEGLVSELKKVPIYLMNGSFGRVSEHNVAFGDQFFNKEDEKNRDLAIKISMEYILARPSGKLYVLCAPSGFGKSSIQDQLSNLCARTLPKITTRPYRSFSEMSSGNIQSVNPNLFRTMVSEGLLLAPHIYNNNAYGLAMNNFQEVFSDKYDAYLWDTCDPESALALRKQHPDRVRVIGIFPTFSFAGLGLERRITGLSISLKDLNEIPPGLLKKEKAILNTKKRLERIMSETRDYRHFLPEFDRFLDGETLDDNISQMVDVIIEDKR